MTTAILTLNAGSSSLKFALYPLVGDDPLASGLADRIGGEGVITVRRGDGLPVPATEKPDSSSHVAALQSVLDMLAACFGQLDVAAVGHRIVHGGPNHAAPLLLDADKLAELEKLNPFAPLHQPHNLAGVRAAMTAFPSARQVACFDTAFHRSHDFVNDVFALPRRYYEAGVRRYGFHGLSYEFVAGELRRVAPALAAGRVIVAHLGNGASLCAMHNGSSAASTMGFSPLDGLPMGTRCGQLDPGGVLFLMDQEGKSAADIADLLYRQSGLLGLSGVSNDMRTLEASRAPAAAQAIDYFVNRIRQEIGAMAAALGGIDALVFCGGIGENSVMIRRRVCEGMAWIGMEVDPARNAAGEAVVSSDESRVRVMVIRTNEEAVIVRSVRAMALPDEQSAA
jgi:acetate kinase